MNLNNVFCIIIKYEEKTIRNAGKIFVYANNEASLGYEYILNYLILDAFLDVFCKSFQWGQG